MVYLRLFSLIFFYLLCSSGNTTVVAAQIFEKNNLIISNASARAMVMPQRIGAAYLTIRNKGNSSDQLIAVRSPTSAHIEIHETILENQVMKMRPVDKGLIIPPHSEIALKPGSYHLMFFDPNPAFKAGDTINATLEFAKNGNIPVTFIVQDIRNEKNNHHPTSHHH